MKRAKIGYVYKLVGIILAVSGLAIVMAKMPSTVWWLLVGIFLILTGARIFIN